VYGLNAKKKKLLPAFVLVALSKKKKCQEEGRRRLVFFSLFKHAFWSLSLSLSLYCAHTPDKKAEEREGEGILYRTVAVFVPRARAHTRIRERARVLRKRIAKKWRTDDSDGWEEEEGRATTIARRCRNSSRN